jgi:hypothetical protein
VCKIRDLQDLGAKIRQTKELRSGFSFRDRLSLFLPLLPSLDLLAFAWVIMNEFSAGGKVRRHRAAVDFFEVAAASKNEGTFRFVSGFSSGCDRI